MPSLDTINVVRKQRGQRPLTEAEFTRRVRPRPADPPPVISQRTIDIRRGLINPHDGDDPYAASVDPFKDAAN